MNTQSGAQPVGPAVPGWSPCAVPPHMPMEGTYSRVIPLDPEAHADDLHMANMADTTGRNWTYLAYGPFATTAAYRDWMRANCCGKDPLFFTLIDGKSGRPGGIASYMRMQPVHGVVEVGHVHIAPFMQRSIAATETMFLMMRLIFDELGYRRYEWKCDALNAPSQKAAHRLGFTYEGTFRQATVYKGRNRDSAWYAMLDREWPAIKRAFEMWLDPENFDASGRQRVALSRLTREVTSGRGRKPS